MRALSLTQPWATAVALGFKHWETRSWPTSFRGEVCIHAAKGFPRWAKDFSLSRRELPPASDLQLGSIVCVCEITECRQTETLAQKLSEMELAYGDYSPGRYAFKLENVRRLMEAIPARGALGLWAVGWNEALAVLRGLKGVAA
jgi:hypothetical protein